jgi:hypothetical protein
VRPGRKGRRIGAPEVEDTPDRWVPPVGERERERRGGPAGEMGRRRFRGPRGKERRGRSMGRRVGLGKGFGFLFFSFFF